MYITHRAIIFFHIAELFAIPRLSWKHFSSNLNFKANVAVHKELFLELASGRVVIVARMR